MSKTKKIFYNYVIGGSEESFLDEGELDFFADDYFEAPTPALKDYPSSYTHSKCPAFKEYYKNTWVMRQSFPLGLLYNSAENYIETNLSQKLFDEYFILGDDWEKMEHPEIQFNQGYCFWTEDKDVWIEQFQHPDMARLGLDTVSGCFPLSVWQRPINLGFTIKTYDKNIWLEKGSPLCYVRFSSQRTRDVRFTLEKRLIPKDVLKRQNQSLWLKDWHKNYSWNLINKRLKKEEEDEKKCPFNFLWKN
tara:strand:- start:603 stop:1346 length:744 start_codon:yes stop_codon:yes gene_type:complete